ncbi:MAG: PAS domain-containing protein [Deltaproteobacteria bacterium]|nr:PAS domain-containing protein [Deltaproteobacteria bacterium]
MGQYQIYIVITVLSLIGNLVLGSVSLAVDHRHRLNRSFAALAFGLAWWALMKLAITFSATEEWASLFYKLSGFGWTFLPAYYVHVVYSMIRKAGGARRYGAAVFVIVSSALCISLWTGDVMLGGMQMQEWGYTDVPGPLFIMGFQPFLIGSFIYLIVELIVYSSRAAMRADRMNGLLVLFGMLIPLVGGGLTNMLLPSLGIYVIELAVPLTTINAIMIAYAGYRYRLLSYRVDYVSRAIITAIDEPLVVIDVDGRVGIANDAALGFLGGERSDVVGSHVNDFLEGRKFDDDFKKNVGAKKSHTWRVDLSREAGESFEADIKASELRNDRGVLVGYVLVGKTPTP